MFCRTSKFFSAGKTVLPSLSSARATSLAVLRRCEHSLGDLQPWHDPEQTDLWRDVREQHPCLVLRLRVGEHDRLLEGTNERVKG